jgi:putative two-component system response regulator
MQQHTVIGHRLLEGSQAPLLDVAASIALTHHERWDGTGYPNGLRGEEIPLAGRIVAVVDVFDALLSDRSYRDALSPAEVLAILERDRGDHFDPDIVTPLLERADEAFAARAPTSPPGMMAISP